MNFSSISLCLAAAGFEYPVMRLAPVCPSASPLVMIASSTQILFATGLTIRLLS
jgi:hypothetical protein